MTYDYFGERKENMKINSLVDFLEKSDFVGWIYCGMDVELDPTVDWNNQNVKIRWFNPDEGFNDKVIVGSLEEFEENFKRVAV